MTNTVYFDPAYGGTGLVVTDDDDPETGLANGGHRQRFVPCLSNEVSVAAYVTAQAALAQSAAATAMNSPGTSATTTSSITVGTGNKSFTMAQTGKAFALGQRLHVASAANVLNFIEGPASAYNSGTGATTIISDTTGGSGTFTDGVISLTASAGVPSSRTISTAGLATGGGDMSANRTITVAEALAADIRTGTTKTKAVTPGDVTDALAIVNLQFGATIVTSGDASLDMSKFIHAQVTMTGNATLPNPINLQVGDSGRIIFIQDATGSRLLSSWGSFWFMEGGKPTLSTAPGAHDYLYYDVVSTTLIVCSIVKNPSN